ncbi:hypothetical protein LXL04_008169 [Taraxacum kok-saghyz]
MTYMARRPYYSTLGSLAHATVSMVFYGEDMEISNTGLGLLFIRSVGAMVVTIPIYLPPWITPSTTVYNIISLSVGSSGYAPQYYRDSIAIGSFGAMQNGILVSCSAGNSGPDPYTATKYRDMKIEEPFPCRPFSFKFAFNFKRKPTILLKNVADDCAPFC